MNQEELEKFYLDKAKEADELARIDDDAKNIDCTADDPGIVHINLDGADSYFTVPAKTVAIITVRSGKPVQCSIQPRGNSN